MFEFTLEDNFDEIKKKYIEVSESINMEQCTFLKMTAK